MVMDVNRVNEKLPENPPKLVNPVTVGRVNVQQNYRRFAIGTVMAWKQKPVVKDIKAKKWYKIA